MSDEQQPGGRGPPRPIRGWRAAAVRVAGTSLGLGYAPAAPGTFGTLPAVGCFLAISLWAPPGLGHWLLGGLLLAACMAAVPLGTWAERLWDRPDPSRFTLDEFAGFLLTVLLFPFGSLWPRTLWALLLTRGMDVIKIPPAWQAQRLPGGWGILLDDLVASLYAAVGLYGLFLSFPGLF